MYDNDLKYFSESYNYSFDLIPEDLSFFEMKKIIQSKIEELSYNNLVFVDNNKILSIQLDESQKYSILYEKAKFFIQLFNSSEKFVLLSENDEFYYGYIDNFPCLFDANFENAKRTMQEYANGVFVCFFGVGDIEKKCNKIISYKEILFLKNIEDPIKIDYLAEESFVYDAEKPDFNNLVMNYLLNNNVANYKNFIIKNFIMLALSFLFIVFRLFGPKSFFSCIS